MKGRIAGTAIAAAMVTTLIAATPALASPLGTTASGVSAAHWAQHHGSSDDNDTERPAIQYAVDLVDAWGDVDTAKVDALATAEVAATLLDVANPDGAAWVHTNSRAIAGIMFSSFVNKDLGQALVIGVEEFKVSGDHAAVIARFVDLPKAKMTAVEYAKQLVAAWGNGDTDQVNKLANDQVAATLLDFANPGGTAWRHTTSREIAGVMFSSFVDRTQGKALVIGVQKSAIDGDDAAVFAWFVDYPMNPIDRSDNARWHHGDSHWTGKHKNGSGNDAAFSGRR
jgi:hypothetical protein